MIMLENEKNIRTLDRLIKCIEDIRHKGLFVIMESHMGEVHHYNLPNRLITNSPVYDLYKEELSLKYTSYYTNILNFLRKFDYFDTETAIENIKECYNGNGYDTLGVLNLIKSDFYITFDKNTYIEKFRMLIDSQLSLLCKFREDFKKGCIKTFKEDSINEVTAKKVRIFFSYASDPQKTFDIPKLALILEENIHIEKVYYWERDSTGSLIDYMNDKVSDSDTCIFFYTVGADISTGVRSERDMAVYGNKHIIPVFTDIQNVPQIIRFNSGINALNKNMNEIAKEIFRLVKEKHGLS